MKFICLGYADEKQWDAMSKSDQAAMIEECFTYALHGSDRTNSAELSTH